MSRADVVAAVRAAGVPCTLLAWPSGAVPPLPWAVYYQDGDNPTCGDNAVLKRNRHYIVELYQAASRFEPSLVDAVQESIESAFGPSTCQGDSWIDDEGTVMSAIHFVERF